MTIEIESVIRSTDQEGRLSMSTTFSLVPIQKTKVVEEGEVVLLVESVNEKTSFVHVKKTGSIRLCRIQCSLSQFIGVQYGSTFEILGGGQLRLVPTPTTETLIAPGVDKVTGDNRTLCLDPNAIVQNLTQDQILEMKKSGTEGGTIVDALIQHSATFQRKTEFAREKYRKKKSKKHIKQVTVLEPTIQSVCDSYFMKKPEKTCYLRSDTLAQLLSRANIFPQSRVLVCEACGGLVAGSIARRMGGYGTVYNCYTAQNPQEQIMHLILTQAEVNSVINIPMYMLESALEETIAATASQIEVPPEKLESTFLVNSPVTSSATPATLPSSSPSFSSEEKVIHELHLQSPPNLPLSISASPPPTSVTLSTDSPHLTKPLVMSPLSLASQGTPARVLKAVPLSSLSSISSSAFSSSPSSLASSSSSSCSSSSVIPTPPKDIEQNIAKKQPILLQRADSSRGSGVGLMKSPTARIRAHKGTIDQAFALLRNQADSLVLACRHSATALFSVLYPYLAFSGQFTIYCPYIEPLASLMNHLRAQHLAIQTILSETWLREYQVLPGRTHPMYSGNTRSGYVLSGIKVYASSTTTQGQVIGNKHSRQ